MMVMTLKQFRIQNYRIIEDTGWIIADSITSLVGINESGKSAILTALYKLNPSIPSPYDGLAEFPHDRYHEFASNGKDIPAASAQFVISDELRQELSSINLLYTKPIIVECTRYYDGELRVTFLPEVSFEELTISKIQDFIFHSEKQVQKTKVDLDEVQTVSLTQTGDAEQPVSPDAKTLITEFKTHMLEQLDNVNTTLKAKKAEKTSSDVLRKLSASLRALSSEDWQQSLTNPIIEQINDLIEIENVKATLTEATDTVIQHLPIFILFEDYGTLRGDIYIPEYLRVYMAEKPPEWVRTANALFKLAAYPIDKITQLYQSTQQATILPKQEGRQLNKSEEEIIQRAVRESAIRKEASSLWITQRFNQWWPVGDYKIHLEPTQEYFQLRVSDGRRDISVELEYRSRGFKYFLSFFLVFEAESDGGHKDSILLLDEPGIHLHPAGTATTLKIFLTMLQNQTN